MIPDVLLAQPVVEKISWVLMHFVWQGALVAAALVVALRMLREHSAQARYAASCAALAAMLALPAVTWGLLPHASHPAEVAATNPVAVEPWSAAEVAGLAVVPEPRDVSWEPAAAPSWYGHVRAGLAQAGPWLVVFWAGGVILLSVRLLGGWIYAQGLRRRATEPAGAAWHERFEALARRLHVARPVRLCTSRHVSGPVAIGWLRPVVLLPGSVLTGLPPAQVEALLAHELAHIRRHDYLVNLMQSVVETVLFYHPAVWWVSSQIRVEREHCCDDLAVSACGSRFAYAQALTELEARRRLAAERWGASLAVAAAGGTLLARIRRLAGAPAPAAALSERHVAGMAVLLVSIALLAAGAQTLEQQEAAVAEMPLPGQGAFDHLPADTTDTDSTRRAVRVVVRSDSTKPFAWHEDDESFAFSFDPDAFQVHVRRWADSLAAFTLPRLDSLTRHLTIQLDTLDLPRVVFRTDSLNGFHAFVGDAPVVHFRGNPAAGFHFRMDTLIVPDVEVRVDTFPQPPFPAHPPMPPQAFVGEAPYVFFLEHDSLRSRAHARALREQARALRRQAEQLQRQAARMERRMQGMSLDTLDVEEWEQYWDEYERHQEAWEEEQERRAEAFERAFEAYEEQFEAREEQFERQAHRYAAQALAQHAEALQRQADEMTAMIEALEDRENAEEERAFLLERREELLEEREEILREREELLEEIEEEEREN